MEITEHFASEEFIAKNTGETIARFRVFVSALCDYQEVGKDAPFNRNEAVRYIARHTSLDIKAIVIMYVLWIGFMEDEGIADETECRLFRQFTDLICDVNG
jgi:hypothetical protein